MADHRAPTGSRSAGYLLAGVVATVPAWLAASLVLGLAGAAAAILSVWCIGALWLAKRRQDDPGWDRRAIGRRAR